MDEAQAQTWLAELDVPRETLQKIDAFVALLEAENAQQNLVSAASLEQVYTRHIVDSAQLWTVARDAKLWLDLGSGAGLPGLIIAILTASPVVLVESRKLRAAWLQHVAQALDLKNVRVEAARLELVPSFPAAVITARAFAPLPKLLTLARRFATPNTIWILPKGQSAPEELASIESTWHGRFDMKPSLTDPKSAIIVARNVKPRGVRQ